MKSSNIEAETAKLAGLQIDFLQKLRNGSITLEGFEQFLNPYQENLQAIFGLKLKDVKASKKFTFFKSFNITVPADYQHDNQLSKFAKNNKQKFGYYNDKINDANFNKVSHQPESGKTYEAMMWFINKNETPSSEEILQLLAENRILLTGAQGLSVVFEQKPEEFPKNKYTVSFDEKDNLWYADGDHHVPGINRDSDDAYNFNLGYFEYDWNGVYCVFGLRDLQSWDT